MTKKPSTKFIIEAQTLKEPQEIDIYLNKELIAHYKLSENKKTYTTILSPNVPSGIHKIRLITSKGYIPSQIMKSLDNRTLYVNIFSIRLE